MFMEFVNPELLKKQIPLVTSLLTRTKTQEDRELLNGVVNLLEAIQDQLDKEAAGHATPR